MKKQLLTITAALLVSALTFAQNVPQGINYQGVARDGNGTALTNQSIDVKFILQNNAVSTYVFYQEEHLGLSTNDFGLFTAVIGDGTNTSGVFSSSELSYWNNPQLKVEINFGSGYVDMGASDLQSVPYSMYSEKAYTADYIDWWSVVGVPYSLYSAPYMWNWADDDATNELQTLSQLGNTVTLSNGGGSVSVADNDNDATNEMQTLSISNDTISLSGANSIVLPANNDTLWADDGYGNIQNTNSGDVVVQGTEFKVKDQYGYDKFTVNQWGDVDIDGTTTIDGGEFRVRNYGMDKFRVMPWGSIEMNGDVDIIGSEFRVKDNSWNDKFKVDYFGDVYMNGNNNYISGGLYVTGNATFHADVSGYNQPTNAEHLTRKDYVDAGDATNATAISVGDSTNNVAILAETTRATAAEAALLDSINTGDSTILANQHWNKLYNVGWSNATVLHYDGKIAIGVSQANINGYTDFQIGEWNDKAEVNINASSFDLEADYFNLNSDYIRINDMDGFRYNSYSGTTLFQARDGMLELNEYSGNSLLNVNAWDGFEVFDGTAYAWNSTPILKVDISNSNVGIGTDNPNLSYALDVVGDINTSGTLYAINVVSSSDKRFKKNITTVDNALSKVLQLRGVNYYWRQQDFPNRKFDDKRELGLIAQEVEVIIPEVVGESADGYKAVEYQKLVALLIEAIKEQQAIIDGQKTEMAEMKANLDSRLKVLEELLNTTTLKN